MGLCDSCHAGCCRSYAVPITGADILRIEQSLGASAWDFICRWADPSGTIARQAAPHFRFADEPKTPFVICLLQTESQVFEGTSKCRFLLECPPDEKHPLGQARCSIYAHRPSACRAFPGRLHESGELVTLADVPERGRSDGHDLYQLCPRPWEVSDVCSVQLVQDLVVSRYEMNFFHRLAESWNRSPGEWRLFPSFVRMVYENRVQQAERQETKTRDAELSKAA